MTADVWSALPSLVWAAIFVLVLVLFRRQVGELLPRVQSVELPGLAVRFGGAVAQAAAEKGRPLDATAKTQVERRAARDAEVLQGARVLWVDDDPDINVREREALRAVGIDVECAVSTDEALLLLRRRDHDLVISDMKRDGDTEAGLELLAKLRPRRRRVPVVFYVGQVDPSRPTPAGAVEVTDHPVPLMHAVFDALERRRG